MLNFDFSYNKPCDCNHQTLLKVAFDDTADNTKLMTLPVYCKMNMITLAKVKLIITKIV